MMAESSITLELVAFFLFGICFLIFANLQAHQLVILNKITKKKYPKIQRKIALIGFGHLGLFIPRPINLIKLIWSNKHQGEDIDKIIFKIRKYQKLSLLFFILALVSPLIINIFFPN